MIDSETRKTMSSIWDYLLTNSTIIKIQSHNRQKEKNNNVDSRTEGNEKEIKKVELKEYSSAYGTQ